MHEKAVLAQFKHRDQVLVFCEQPEVLRDVDLLYENKRRLRMNVLQHRFRCITERAIRFRIKLELDRFSFQQNRLSKVNTPKFLFQCQFASGSELEGTLYEF